MPPRGVSIFAAGILAALACAVPASAAAPLFEAPFLEFEVARSPSGVAIADLNGDGRPDLVVPAFNSDAVSVLLGNGDRTFGARTDFPTGHSPQAVAVGDLDGDGRLDLVATASGANAISVLLGNGDGTFRQGGQFAAGTYPQHVALADVNGDAKLDAIVTDRGTNTVSVLPGRGDGTFGARTEFPTGTTPLWVAVGSLNGDSYPDLVVADNGTNTISVLLGRGDGTFRARSDFVAGPAPRALALADLDGDGQLDVAVANSSGSTVTVLRGFGDGTFGTRVSYAVGPNPQAVVAVDLDHDGRLDLASANTSGNTVSVLAGLGDGTFGPHADFRAGNQPNALAAADLDADGAMDLVATCLFTWDFAEVAVLPGNGDRTFGAQRHTATGADPWALVGGDLDRDGVPDLVTANYGANTVSVLLGRGDGTFEPRADYATGASPDAVALGDLDRDGRLDLVVANRGAGTVSVLMGRGDGTFAPKRDVAAGAGPLALALGDVDGDGWPDLAVVNRASNTVAVLRGNGDGTFRPATAFATGTDPFGVAIGDLDGDGRADLAVVNSSANTVSVLIGNGDGTFRPAVDRATGGQPYSVAIADLDADGRQDLVVADRGSNAVSVLMGLGGGAFAPHVDYVAGLFPQSVAVGDLDRDGHLDLAVANEQSHSASVLLGRGDGTFAPRAEYGAGTYARALAIADLDSDQGADLAVACFSMNTVTLLRNAFPPPMANPVTVGPPSGPLAPPDTCVTVPVTIRRTSADAVRGFHATLTLSPELRLCGAGVVEGGYLSAASPNVHLEVLARGGGVYTVDGAILGTPCGATAASGTLFAVHVATDSTRGTGRVTVSDVVLRDCANAGVACRVASPGWTEVPILPPGNPVALGMPSGCITSVDTCITLPVAIARTTGDPLRGFRLGLRLSGGLRLCGAGASEGGYLGAVNPNVLYTVEDQGGGSYAIQGAIVGSPCGATAPAGTLVILHLASDAPSGTGSASLAWASLWDCDAHAVPSSADPVAATVSIDNVRPPAVAGLVAAREPGGTATSRIVVSWAPADSVATVELYRTSFGGYPEYDGAGGSAPGTPGWPPEPRWVHLASLPSGTSFEDDPGLRDAWYYAAFARDGCGNVSLAATTAGTLDYRLGDVSDGRVQCRGNGRVWTEDLSLLGSRYGGTLAPGDPLACLDVGPTSDGTLEGRPLTDGALDFEDLMVFSTAFDAPPGVLPAPALAERDEVLVDAPERVVEGQVFTAVVRLEGAGNLQGLSARLGWDRGVAELVEVVPGAMVAEQGGVAWRGRGGSIDAALLGARDRGLAGDGTLATATFRARASGAPRVAVASVDARGRGNQPIALGGGARIPAITSLLPVAPNPARGAATLGFDLARPGQVELAVYSVDGRRVRTVVRGTLPAGEHRPAWSGTDDAGHIVRPGFYWARLTTPDRKFSRPFVLLR